MAEHPIIDLHFTENGCRKTITKYVGQKGYCHECDKYYAPPDIEQFEGRVFGHALQAWVIYQRMILRLPYRAIIQVMEDSFAERVSLGTIIRFFKRFAQYYEPTERLLIQRLFETFVFEVKNLLVPIFEAVEMYGLKRRHLHKFHPSIDRFYQQHIVDRTYMSEATIKFQKRFLRYRDSLFTFLDEDGLPWQNNTAERALRHLAVQRKISGSFFEKSTHHFLLLLGISQTCQFQNKSFLKFLLSKELDIDAFKSPKRIQTSRPVSPTRAVDGQ